MICEYYFDDIKPFIKHLLLQSFEVGGPSRQGSEVERATMTWGGRIRWKGRCSHVGYHI